MAQEITFTKQADGTWQGSFTSTGTRTIVQVEREENAPLYLNISADNGQHNVIYQPPKNYQDQILCIDIAEGALVTVVSHSAVTDAYYIASELDYYTKAEVDELIVGIHQFEPVVASSLPTASADTMYKFYFIPKQSASEQTNTKEEWMTVKEGSTYRWEKIGETEVDLSDYVTAEDLEEYIENSKSFKGWFGSSSALLTAYPSPKVGDYAYIKGATASDLATIYECATAGTWSDSGRTVDTSSVQKFATGEEVNETYIDDTHLVNPKDHALPTATDVMQLKVKLEGVTASETKIGYIDGSLLTGHYISSGGSTSGTSSNYDCATFDVDGYKAIRFLGVEMSSSQYSRGYAFYDSNGDYIDGTYKVYDVASDGTGRAKEYVEEVPQGAKYFKTNVRIGNLLNSEDFYCYLQIGESVVDLIPEVVNNLNTGGITKALSAEQGKVLDSNTRSNDVTTYDDDSIFLTHGCYVNINGTTGSTTAIDCLYVPVKQGDVVTIRGVSPDNSTIRFWAFYNQDGSQVSYADRNLGDFRTNGLEIVVPENAVVMAVNYSSYNSETDYTTIKSKNLTGFELDQFEKNYKSQFKSEVYTSSNVSFEDGYLVLTVGSNASVGPSGTSNSKHGIIAVKKGQIIHIKLAWSSNGRGYYFTDDSFGRVVLVAGDSAVSITNPVTVIAPSDGFLYLNCSAARLSELKVIVTDTNDSIANQYNVSIGRTSQFSYIDRYHNAPLPRNKQTLKIFGIGNSHMNNSTMYIKELLQAVNIDNTTLDTKVALYYVGIAAATIDTWVDSKGSLIAYNRGGSNVIGSGNLNGTLDELLASQDWDIVVIQQYSGVATNIDSYANLPKLIARIRQNCPNQNVCIAYNMTWGYKTNMNYLPNTNEAMWSMICTAVQKMMANYGVDVVIPTGTAIQNARQQSIASIMRSSNDKDLTNDGTHLAPGVAKYVAASTWFQTLIAPAFGVSILGNPANHIIDDEPGAEGEGSVDDSTGVDVTDTNRFVCQQCAFFATIDKYSIWEIELD